MVDLNLNLYAAPAIRLAVLDLPSLGDCRSCCPIIQFAAALESHQPGQFDGAEVFWSRDDVNFEPLAVVTEQACVGIATSVLAAPQACLSGLDLVNTVTVEVLGQKKPESVSLDDLLDGKNLALLGGEIVGFRDVTQVDEITFTLSALLRGRLATEALQGVHAVGDEFVVLEPADLTAAELRLSDVDTDRYFRAVSKGGSVDDAISIQRRIRGMNLRPPAPGRFAAVRNSPSSNDVTLSWAYRTSSGVRLLASTSLGDCGCCDVRYELEIWNTADSLVLRTIELDGLQEYAYTAAQQSADGLAPGGAFKTRVYAMSSRIGRGVGAFLDVP